LYNDALTLILKSPRPLHSEVGNVILKSIIVCDI